MKARSPGRIRGLGAGRKTRRNLERGGTGAAGELNEAVGGWPRVRITPMFGRWGYFVGPPALRMLPASFQGHGPVDPAHARRPAAGAPDGRRRASPPACLKRMGGVHDRDDARRGTCHPLAPARLSGGDGSGRARGAGRALMRDHRCSGSTLLRARDRHVHERRSEDARAAARSRRLESWRMRRLAGAMPRSGHAFAARLEERRAERSPLPTRVLL